jgi:hypothetical protein
MFSKPLVSATLKPLVLSMLAEGPMYGFQITHRAKILADGVVGVDLGSDCGPLGPGPSPEPSPQPGSETRM